MAGYNLKKTVQALNFFATKENGRINKLKALKLIWLSDRYHLLSNGRMITNDTYFALPNGTVPSITRDILEQNEISLNEDELTYSSCYLIVDSRDRYLYNSISPVDEQVFSQSDINSLQLIYETYGKLTWNQLSDLSHTFPEWKRFESGLSKKIASRYEMNIEDFFLLPENQPLFQNIEPLLDTSKEIYFTQRKIENIF